MTSFARTIPADLADDALPAHRAARDFCTPDGQAVVLADLDAVWHAANAQVHLLHDWRLGEVLVANGSLQPEALQQALARQRSQQPHQPLGQLLQDAGLVTPAELNVALAATMSMPVVDTAELQPEPKRAEQELLHNRELLLSILDNAEAAIYAKDAQGRFLLSNRHHATLLGRSAQDVIGKTDADFVSDSALLALYRAQDQAVLAHARAMEFEDTVQGPGGPRAYASIKFPLRDGGGRIYGVCALSTDVTERRRTAEAYRQKAEELERLMQVTPVGIWVSYDPQCRHVSGNRMANAMFEVDDEENLSENPSENLPATGGLRRRYFGADGRELQPHEPPMQQAVARGEDVRDQEITVLLPSGRRRTLLCSATPLRDAANQVRGCLCTGLEITDRVAVEQALRESESKLRALADNMAQLAWMADEQGLAFWFNLQWFDFSGLTPLAANGDGWLHLVHPDHRQRVAQGIRRHAAEGRIWEAGPVGGRCAGVGAWRPHPAGADGGQPAAQRHQVHRLRRLRGPASARRGPRRAGAAGGRGQRHRHGSGLHAPALPALHAGRPQHRPQPWRPGPGAGAGQGPGRAAWRRGAGAQRRPRPRLALHRHRAAGCVGARRG